MIPDAIRSVLFTPDQRRHVWVRGYGFGTLVAFNVLGASLIAYIVGMATGGVREVAPADVTYLDIPPGPLPENVEPFVGKREMRA